MRKKIIAALQYTFFLGLGLILLWYSSRNLTREELDMMKKSIQGAEYWVAIPAAIVFIASHYSRAIRWKILMEPLGFNPSTRNTFIAVMLSYFFNLLVPRLGEVMKCTLLAKYENAPVDKLVGTMVAERAMDVISLFVVILITLVFQIDLLGQFARTEYGHLLNFRFDPMSAGVVLLIFVGTFFSIRFFLIRYAHIAVIQKSRSVLSGVWVGLTSIRYLKKKKEFFFHSVFIWAMYLMGIRLGFLAMDSVEHLGIFPAFTILSFGSLAMIVTQGGIGAYQLAVQNTLTLYGINAVQGLAFGWLLWLFQTLLIIFTGIILLILLPLLNKPRK
jgi:uncharacterized membrane protein YbhN (UPF0104 family)